MSPDQAYIAMILVFDCGGATVRPDTTVVVRAMADEASSYSDGTVLTLNGFYELDLQWVAARTLRVRYPGEARFSGGGRPPPGVTVVFERK